MWSLYDTIDTTAAPRSRRAATRRPIMRALITSPGLITAAALIVPAVHYGSWALGALGVALYGAHAVLTLHSPSEQRRALGLPPVSR